MVTIMVHLTALRSDSFKKPGNIYNYTLVLGIVLLFSISVPAEAQIPRERVDREVKVDKVFWAPVNVGISTVDHLPEGNLNSTVLHTFGIVHGGDGRRGIDSFFGLDDGANTRLGVDYGFTDRFSAGIGRMTFNKVVDIRGKYHLLHQTESDSTPLDVAIKASTGINTTRGFGDGYSDRTSYFASLMVARKFDPLSVQLTPMVAHVNSSLTPEIRHEQLFGFAVLANYDLSDRFSLSAEYLPVLGERVSGTRDAMAVTLNIDTGGHIFQLFFTSSQWHNEQYIMANNRHRFWEGDFRFGFNIHRVFRPGR